MPIQSFEKIINHINKYFSVDNNAEITLEANPGTINVVKMHEFQTLGVNRLSIGVQSLDDNKLKYLGRTHDAATAIKTIEYAQRMNLRVSGDFIYGLPDEDTDDVINACKKINNLRLTHCSLYELTVEPGTPLAKSAPQMPSNETMAQMYIAIQDTLTLPRYEVSNYATPGCECRHNMNIWDGQAYIGIGTGAAGRIYHNNTWYEQRGNGTEFELMSENERAVEKIITGLRMTRGVCLTDDIKNAINIDAVHAMTDLLVMKNDRLQATDAGILVLDDIMVKIVR